MAAGGMHGHDPLGVSGRDVLVLDAAEMTRRLESTKREIERLKVLIEGEKVRLNTGGLSSVKATRRAPMPRLLLRQTLSGHFNKVTAVDWASDSIRAVSAGQDSKLLFWDALEGVKTSSIALKSSWVTTCAFEREHGRIVACGGLDNVCSLYSVPAAGTASTARPLMELRHHDGYLSCCRFIDSTSLITSSGDSTCVLWDLTTPEVKQTFVDHAADVSSISISPENRNVFISGSCDLTAKVWDIRVGRCVQTFAGHDSDINAVQFMPNSACFGTASDDATCKLFDLRSYARLNEFTDAGTSGGIFAVEFSRSGSLIFGGSDNHRVAAWETLEEEPTIPQQELDHHSARVSCLAINPRGQAVISGSWDTTLNVRARRALARE